MGFLNDVPFMSRVLLPIMDITLLAYLLFKLYELLEETRAIQLLRGSIVLVLIYVTAWILRLSTLLWILEKITPGLFIGVAIVFQPELRNLFTRIGQRELFRGNQRDRSFKTEVILSAVTILSSQKRGALVVFAKKVGLKNIIDSGTLLNAEISSSLLLSIFGHNSPLHDGAVVVQENKLTAAGCFLPLSNNPNILESFGTRHRAALGMAEETDALVLIVSEETGTLSLAYDGNLFYNLKEEEIKERMHSLLHAGESDSPKDGRA